MSRKWKITTLVLGHHQIDLSLLLNEPEYRRKAWVPVIAAAITDGTHKILVDTGHSDAGWVSDYITPATASENEKLAAALRIGCNWSVDDVETVINTHLHFDHCGCNQLFRKAKFVVQQKEWDHATSPQGLADKLYVSDQYNSSSVNPNAWIFIDGEVELFDGLRLVPTPGHTPGHMSVLVDTDQGTVCIGGDLSGLMDNINRNISSSVAYSEEETLSSFQIVRDRADYLIPGHDPCIRPFQTSHFPEIKK